jgi:hypothetical protein
VYFFRIRFKFVEIVKRSQISAIRLNATADTDDMASAMSQTPLLDAKSTTTVIQTTNLKLTVIYKATLLQRSTIKDIRIPELLKVKNSMKFKLLNRHCLRHCYR